MSTNPIELIFVLTVQKRFCSPSDSSFRRYLNKSLRKHGYIIISICLSYTATFWCHRTLLTYLLAHLFYIVSVRGSYYNVNVYCCSVLPSTMTKLLSLLQGGGWQHIILAVHLCKRLTVEVTTCITI